MIFYDKLALLDFLPEKPSVSVSDIRSLFTLPYDDSS